MLKRWWGVMYSLHCRRGKPHTTLITVLSKFSQIYLKTGVIKIVWWMKVWSPLMLVTVNFLLSSKLSAIMSKQLQSAQVNAFCFKFNSKLKYLFLKYELNIYERVKQVFLKKLIWVRRKNTFSLVSFNQKNVLLWKLFHQCFESFYQKMSNITNFKS